MANVRLRESIKNAKEEKTRKRPKSKYYIDLDTGFAIPQGDEELYANKAQLDYQDWYHLQAADPNSLNPSELEGQSLKDAIETNQVITKRQARYRHLIMVDMTTGNIIDDQNDYKGPLSNLTELPYERVRSWQKELEKFDQSSDSKNPENRIAFARNLFNPKNTNSSSRNKESLANTQRNKSLKKDGTPRKYRKPEKIYYLDSATGFAIPPEDVNLYSHKKEAGSYSNWYQNLAHDRKPPHELSKLTGKKLQEAIKKNQVIRKNNIDALLVDVDKTTGSIVEVGDGSDPSNYIQLTRREARARQRKMREELASNLSLNPQSIINKYFNLENNDKPVQPAAVKKQKTDVGTKRLGLFTESKVKQNPVSFAPRMTTSSPTLENTNISREMMFFTDIQEKSSSIETKLVNEDTESALENHRKRTREGTPTLDELDEFFKTSTPF